MNTKGKRRKFIIFSLSLYSNAVLFHFFWSLLRGTNRNSAEKLSQHIDQCQAIQDTLRSTSRALAVVEQEADLVARESANSVGQLSTLFKEKVLFPVNVFCDFQCSVLCFFLIVTTGSSCQVD